MDGRSSSAKPSKKTGDTIVKGLPRRLKIIQSHWKLGKAINIQICLILMSKFHYSVLLTLASKKAGRLMINRRMKNDELSV